MMNSNRNAGSYPATAVVRQAVVSSRRRCFQFVVAALALALASLFWGAAAKSFAHDQLLDSTPAVGSTFEDAPSEAKLVFSGFVQSLGTEFLLQDGNQGVVDLPGQFSIQGKNITVPLPKLGSGSYSLNWRVVSEDGHPVSGAIPFKVGSGEAVHSSEQDGQGQTGSAGGGNSEGLSAQEQNEVSPVLVGLLSVVAVLGFCASALVVVRKMRGNKFSRSGEKPWDEGDKKPGEGEK